MVEAAPATPDHPHPFGGPRPPARVLIPELSIDRADTNDSPMVVMNWLLDVTSALIKKKANQEEVEKLNIKIDSLEKEWAEPQPQSPTAPGITD